MNYIKRTLEYKIRAYLKRKEIIAALNAEYRFFDQNIIAARDRYERLEKERILTGEQSELNDEKFSAILREIGIR